MSGITLIVCLDVGYYADSVSGCRVYAVRMSGCRVLSCQSVWILDIMFTMFTPAHIKPESFESRQNFFFFSSFYLGQTRPYFTPDCSDAMLFSFFFHFFFSLKLFASFMECAGNTRFKRQFRETDALVSRFGLAVRH